MLDRWLRGQQHEAHSPMLGVNRMIADVTAEDTDLDEWLGHELMRNYFSPAKRKFLANQLTELGVGELAERVQQTALPGKRMIRTGEFGEALAGAVFRKMRRYCVPILKLRFKQTPEAAVHGADLLAFRLNKKPPVIAVPEVKTRSTKNLDVGKEAHKSLNITLRTLDASLDFIVTQLVERGNAALGTRLFRLIANPDKVIERHVVVVHDDDAWDDRILDRLGEVVEDPTEATVILMKSLWDRITATYAAAARHVHPEGRRTASTSGTEPAESTGA
jgi:hypothetical protein